MEINKNGKYSGRAVLHRGVTSSPLMMTDSRSPFFNYGKGFFETMLYENGGLQYFEEHLLRMKNTCRDFDIHLDYSQVEEKKIYNYLQEIGLRNHCCRVKILYAPIEEANRWDTVVSAAPYTRPAKNFILSVHDEVYDSKLNRYKSLNYNDNLHWKDHYHKIDQSDEVLFCNKEGNILEGSYTNILFEKDSTIYYVDKCNNYLQGIMQDQILDVAVEIEGLKIEALTKGIPIDLLKQADEVLISNSLMQVQNVRKIINGDEVFTWPLTVLKKNVVSKLRTAMAV